MTKSHYHGVKEHRKKKYVELTERQSFAKDKVSSEKKKQQESFT